MSLPAAAAPTSSTWSWSIGSERIPAAMFVTQEMARQRTPMCRAASTSGTVDMPTMSPPIARMKRTSAGVSYAGPSQAAYTPSSRSMPSRAAARQCLPAETRVVGVAHVREARAKRVLVRPDERRDALQVDVVGEHHERPRVEILADPAAGVRQHERADPEAGEHPDAEHDLSPGNPSYMWARPRITASGTPAIVPRTSRPACPTAVDDGQPGISSYGISTASSSSSARGAEPGPEHDPNAWLERRAAPDQRDGSLQVGRARGIGLHAATLVAEPEPSD